VSVPVPGVTDDEPAVTEGAGVETSGGEPTAQTAEAAESGALARLDAFPWGTGVLVGAASFLVSYLLLVGWVFLGPASLPGSTVEQLKRVGFLLYNAQGVLVVADTPPDVVALPVDLLSRATLPIVYRAVPAVVLFVASAAFARWRWVDGSDGVAVLATGAAVALGYLAVALVGTYVFVIVQSGVPFHPDRIESFLFVTGYGLVFGLFGSMVARARGAPA